MKFAFRLHISRWNTHTLSYVDPLEEHTGSSNEGQLFTHRQRASLGPNALHTAKYLQETLMQGSRSAKIKNEKEYFYRLTVKFLFFIVTESRDK